MLWFCMSGCRVYHKLRKCRGNRKQIGNCFCPNKIIFHGGWGMGGYEVLGFSQINTCTKSLYRSIFYDDFLNCLLWVLNFYGPIQPEIHPTWDSFDKITYIFVDEIYASREWDLDDWLENLTGTATKTQQSCVQSQYPPTQWNQRDGRWSSVE